MNTPESIHWIVSPSLCTPAVEYTIRLLSSLMDRHADISDAKPAAPPADLTVCYGVERPSGFTGALWIEPDLTFWEAVASGRDITPRSTQSWADSVVPVWDSRSPAGPGRRDDANLCPMDPVAATFFLVSRIEEWRNTKFDTHGRFPADGAWMVREELIERPLVHEYAAAIARAVGLHGESLGCGAAWAREHRFALAFTHDVDRMRMHGPLWQDLRRAAGSLRFPGRTRSALHRLKSRIRVGREGGCDPYDTFDYMTNLHEEQGFRATFFWINSKPSVRDADYRPLDSGVQRLIQSLQDRGFEIGLHGSYGSFDQPDVLRAEREGLALASGGSIVAARQHYLRLRPSETWRAQIEAGLSVDSTLGFAERFGFRAGLAVPFRPWDFSNNRPFDLWEVPLVMMDGTAREYMRLIPGEASTRSRGILRRIADVGGAAAVLWHNSSFDDTDWPGWEPVYREWLEATTALGGWGTTVSDIASAWREHLNRLGNS